MKNYEKLYKEVLERLRTLVNNAQKKHIIVRTEDIEDTFPELKDEDERIRKTIIRFFKDQYSNETEMYDGSVTVGKAIAWLEKQGKSQVRTGIEWLNAIDDACDKRYEGYAEGEYCHEQSFKWGFQEGVEWLEKQGEQKETLCDKCKKEQPSHSCQDITALGRCALEKQGDKSQGKTTFEAITEVHNDNANKVEPKFHEGEWIVWKNKYYKVNDNGCGYELIDQNGLSTSLEYGTVDNYAHLWTIKDAKNGDMLAISWREDNNFWEKIVIFKKYHNKGVEGLYYVPCIEGYGNTFKNGVVMCEEVPYYSKTWTANLHPATREQCDLLFSNMKEAGYEWDAIKKELIKIKDEMEE